MPIANAQSSPSQISYILVDIHGVLTDGHERKRFLEYMFANYGMDYDQHNSLWTNHIAALDTNQETTVKYLDIINNTFGTQISVNQYFQTVIEQIHVNDALLELLRDLDR